MQIFITIGYCEIIGLIAWLIDLSSRLIHSDIPKCQEITFQQPVLLFLSKSNSFNIANHNFYSLKNEKKINVIEELFLSQNIFIWTHSKNSSAYHRQLSSASLLSEIYAAIRNHYWNAQHTSLLVSIQQRSPSNP